MGLRTALDRPAVRFLAAGGLNSLATYLLYLALLFVAMGVDRAIPYERGPRPGELIILNQPDAPGAAAEDHSGH